MTTNISSTDFWAFIKKILLPYSLIIMGLGLLTDYVFTQYIVLGNENMEPYKVKRLMEEDKAAEIPIIGSSRALNNFMPDSIHKECFNYGLEGTGGDVLTIFLKHELAKKRKTPIILNFDYTLEPSAGDFSNYLLSIQEEDCRTLMEKNFRPYYYVPFFRYFGSFENFVKAYLNQKTGLTKSYSKGAVFEKNAATEKQFQAWIKQRLETKSKWKHTKLADEFYEMLGKSDRTIYVVISPLHASCFQSFENMPEMEKYLQKIDALPNVSVLDFGKSLIEDKYFYDTRHLNISGAKYFSANLRKKLAEIDSTFAR